MAARAWGFWTKGKLDILRRYLDGFTTASKKRADEILYLDLFAGQPENRDRLTESPIEGSARIALQTRDAAFSRLRFFELALRAKELEQRLRSDFPGRDVRVHAGDCNVTIHDALVELKPLNWAPTFAFIDPNGPDIHWTTLEALARFKRPKATRVELWILFAHGMFTRLLSTRKPVAPEFARRVTLMFGTSEWEFVHRARVSGRITPADARAEYVNLMRWRIEEKLGYRWTHALQVVNEANRPLYDMIFATDHDAGNRIMSNLYNAAANELPAMRSAALEFRRKRRDDVSGVMRLFDADEASGDDPHDRLYEHLPPETPYWLTQE